MAENKSIESFISVFNKKFEEAAEKIIKSKVEEEKLKKEYKVGDIVKYKKEDGEEAESEIIKIDGNDFFFKDSEGNEFSKQRKEIIGKSEKKKE